MINRNNSGRDGGVTSLPKLAITLGDPAGIGPEIALKAALDPRVLAVCRPLLVGDRSAVARHAGLCGIDVRIDPVESAAEDVAPGTDQVTILHRDHFSTEPLQLGLITAAHGRAAVDAARAAIEAALAGQVGAVVACPQTESAIHAAGIEFDGYPSFVARCTGVPVEDAYLMMCFDAVRIVHATLHVSLREALDLVTEARVLRVISATHAVLSHDGRSPRIAVAGINPHASEGGLFGFEEARIIEPALATARSQGIDVDGPFGVDTLFKKPGYDAFVVMYHDQGHLAAKLLATNRIAGLTIGTPILFASVGHGSALDIAGKNKATPDAVIEAVLRVAAGATGGMRANPEVVDAL
ncbi:terephthalate dihydrodiol dehydrogenase [Pusillimonas caeni]|uniref:PdxA family dehydrogenase n=1 Tax=Pusillimonas caeni TaxID=1348472 RepID=UPI000E59E5A5|nr:4-hydroxythreonine-4-phosphate dehydrogenase PdxA [Pusillimonas caeni]TFL10146.1 terephthalate dihydrodiol dehydrogenase [Pusillimonas caeni]